MSKMTQEVADATAEQKAGGEIIVKTMENVRHVSGENLKLANEMVDVAKDTITQVEDLLHSVSGFRIR